MNEKEIAGLIQLAKDGFVDIAAVGNEVMYREDLSEQCVFEYTRAVINCYTLNVIVTRNDFVEETTGRRPTSEELAQALKRYFVLKEIKDNIEMARGDG